MTDERSVDEAFLADVTGFLDELEPSAAGDAAELLQHSQRLLAETAALLAACEGPSETDDERRERRNRQAAKRRRRHRDKLKAERQALHEQEKTLSDRLRALQQAKEETQERSVLDPEWEAVASRQRQGRWVAEQQQRRLRRAVARRHEVALEMAQMLRRQLCGLRSLQVEAKDESKDERLDADDVALFEDYAQGLDAVYARTDEALQECALEDKSRASYKVGPVRRRDGDVEYLESIDVLLAPHGFKQTCSAMWQAMVLVHQRQGRQQYRGVVDPDNTIAVKLRIPCLRDSEAPVDVLVHLVTRRYVEAERMIIVWRAMTEGVDEFSGMHFDEYGWCVIRPNKDRSHAAMPTIMETFARFLPMSLAPQFEDKARSDQFARFVVTSGEDDGAEISRMMKTLLLDDSAIHDTTRKV
ncbi:unnamed protein product [Phytophthora fragariaefolia]|uniref:Unnamed protein product n=1 Tax=Phytophthora fragariaefolia TaxID=1490495 RepID=A0A9W6Y740_9STRA|nr:unnamed protein product [Phytophthora fragariaefolia]